MSFNEIVGQERFKKIMGLAINSKRLSHAYLFLGPGNTGKRFAAMVVAKSLLCSDFKEDPCDKCPACKKIEKRSHPDLFIVEPEKDIISIETVRKIKKFVGFKPFEGDKKIIIIDRVDKMKKEAANSLLKTLEEPPLNTLFILLCPNAHSLFPTILSRCQRIRFHLLPSSAIRDFLIKKYAATENEAEQLSSLARGKIGNAIRLKEDKDTRNRDRAWELLSGLSLGKIDVILKKAKEMSREKDCLDEIFEWLFLFTRDMSVLNAGAGSEHIINRDRAEDIRRLSENLSVSKINRIYESLKRTRALLGSNVNCQLALENMMMDISCLKYGARISI